jgi:hypothetical protein
MYVNGESYNSLGQRIAGKHNGPLWLSVVLGVLCVKP